MMASQAYEHKAFPAHFVREMMDYDNEHNPILTVVRELSFISCVPVHMPDNIVLQMRMITLSQ
jgi:hypothetical protein